MLRSKANWIEYGEKPTNFFCSLEKKNYINKNVKKIIDSTGNIYTEQMEILNQISNFYQNLYSTKDEGLNRVDLNYVVESNIPKLTKEESDQLEGKLTLPELGKAVRNMKNGKSPGPDGFTVEFYKFFWTDICHFLLRSLNFSFYTGELSLTQKQGIISIIPKGQKPRQYLKNWRPISLLNVSYKILTSTLSNRLKLVLNKLIHENQKGFLSGRYIGENTRLVYDILNYTEQMNKPGLLLLIDFEKAFDSISWDFLFSVIRFFNFGPDFERWIHIISRNVKLCVIQNGFFSQFFNIGRGCRQGDPISPYLFLLCVEILGMLIRKTKNIKGINISDVEYKLFQFADDMGIFLDGSENSLRNTLNLIDQFSKFSGLKPNYDKTKCIWIGSKKGSTTRLCKNIHLEWTDEPFSLLGIKFSTNLKDIAELNFTDRLNDIQNSILMWNKRNLTVLGKITVVKTILLSKLTHLLISLPSPNKVYIKALETMLYNYIWGSKTDRISRNQITKDYKEGGCRMVHIDIFIKSLKLSWIRRIFYSDASWKTLFSTMYKTDQKKLESFGNYYPIILTNKFKNDFWKETLLTYSELQSQFICDKNEDILSTSLWYNDNIKIDNTPVFFMNLYERGVRFISDLFDKDGKIYTYDNLCNKYGVTLPIISYYGLRRAIFSK